jgi:hypothetical protein
VAHIAESDVNVCSKLLQFELEPSNLEAAAVWRLCAHALWLPQDGLLDEHLAVKTHAVLRPALINDDLHVLFNVLLQGEAAAAQAMAASGLPTGASLEADAPPDYAQPSIHSSTAPTAPLSSATTGSAAAPAAATYANSSGSNGGTPTAAAGSSEGMGGDPLAVSNLLGFIKSHKLTGGLQSYRFFAHKAEGA